MIKALNAWYVYIIRCADDSLYTGITTDLKRRLVEHNSNDTKAARYTKSRRPVELVYKESFGNRASVSQREYEIKRMSRVQKLDLIEKTRNT